MLNYQYTVGNLRNDYITNYGAMLTVNFIFTIMLTSSSHTIKLLELIPTIAFSCSIAAKLEYASAA
jgi:hypothetical protein